MNDHFKSKITIDWLVDQKSNDGMYYIAGIEGGKNNITGINIMDNPDTVPWLKPNELILSTGYLLTSTDLYETIISDLHKQNCSGLGIKLNRYIDKIPDEMIKQANDLNFPIICIPFNNTMEEISNLIYHNIFLEEMSSTQKTANLYKNISSAALKKHNLSSVVKELSLAYDSMTFLTNSDFDIMEYSIPKQEKNMFPFSFTSHSSTLFPSNVIMYLKSIEKNSPVPVQKYMIEKDAIKYNFIIFPISYMKIINGYLIFLESQHEFNSIDYETLQNIVPIINVALSYNNLFSREQISSRYLFYNNILSGKYSTPSEIEPACVQNDFNYKKHRVCILLRSSEYSELSMAKRPAFERKFFDIIREILDNKNISHNIAVYDNDFVLFFSEFTNQSDIFYLTSNITKDILARLKSNDFLCKAGISQCYNGSMTIQKCYSQTYPETTLLRLTPTWVNIVPFS